MEVATTNNHSQSHHHHNHNHHHLQAHHSNHSNGGSGGTRSPFQREVREWQRIDPETGALFSGRLEADRWINGPLNSYGKISDSQNISQPNGTQHTQRKQLEVLQARTANGAMQVIRTQTVQKTSSTSRWSSSFSSTSSSTTANAAGGSSHWAPLQPLPMPLPLPLSMPSLGVDISEVSSDAAAQDDVDDGRSCASDCGFVDHTANEMTTELRNGHSQGLVDDHVDFVVINGHSDIDDDYDGGGGGGSGGGTAHFHKLGHNLLLDTAPSLKLSNLMKSSSSISSQSSNSSNLTTATATNATPANNTHRNAGKISLHAIVGQTASTAKPHQHQMAASSSATAATAAAASPTSAAASTPPWQRRLTEQPDLYGKSNHSSLSSQSSKLKSMRVGGYGGGGGGGGGGGVGADVAAATPTQRRRDLESFRHYNDDGNSSASSNSSSTKNATANADDGIGNGNGDDDDLRLTARHQRRQQVSQSVYAPPVPATLLPLQRSRSISTDDLSNDWERQHSDEEPGEWRRVSKLRRSFQSQDYHAKAAPPTPSARRPLDLPSNSVSVARMRAELENGRRLHTAMRNNHVDLAAIDNILNPPAVKPVVAKRSTFLTAESLQEIRGKLKKLSDESLYKADFLAYQAHRSNPSRAEPISEQTEPAISAEQPIVSAFRPVHNTHSLESRQRQKESSSSEWHLRRKSYGFEKMSPPEDKSIFRVDASTDSGLGRSGEQLGNWSPTERNGGGTIIHFGTARKPAAPVASPKDGELSKRHSIAVEETWRDVRKTSQVHVNGSGLEASSTANALVSTSNQLQHRSSAQKRVEFCKTEVHFAAESGRVNIVETDGKPPPTQNFRRRRRTASGPLQTLVKSSSAVSSTSSSSTVTHFGEDPQRHKTIASSTLAYRATLMEPPELISQPNGSSSSQVTVTVPKPVETRFSLLEATSTSRNSYTSTSGVDTTDNETDELSNIRGILKNKPIKPKPYHLGENIESAEVLWSVPTSTMRHTERESPLGRECAPSGELPMAGKSVAERVRIVEQRQFDAISNQQVNYQQQQQPSPAGNGYSTKINLSLGADDWSDTGGHYTSTTPRRASAQQLLLQDLRTHQRILDEGLKSTSLIMKTMRSANEFDEAMRRLSIASIESAILQPTIVVPTPMLRSHSHQESDSTSRKSSITSIASSDLFGSALYDSLPRAPLPPLAPLAPPRLKLLGNTHIPVSQQLTQLRRMYDAAADDEEADSADEEVKRYFRDTSNSDSGGGTQDSSPLEEVRTGSEYSSSWSRLKARRTIWKIEAQEQTLQRADLPKSNVMNIALHAPKPEKPKAAAAPAPSTLRIGQLVPVAKPRTLFVQPQPVDSADESLKIVKEARGARKLREHELSYFGVQTPPQQPVPTKHHTTPTTNPRRTLPTRSKLTHNDDATATTTTPTSTTTTMTSKWQLLNDRPDLLRHSPHGIEAQQPPIADFDEHCYENIANEVTTTFRVKSPSLSPSPSRSPHSYERKADLQRDAQILSEMTRNADQTMKALSDEAALKDQRRRSTSLQRRAAKPLETIDEKVYNAERQALNVARGTFASEARRNSRHSTPSPSRACSRSSSQSSIEIDSCPRARSRSLSSEREFVATKTRPRSSSRESQTHGGGASSDEQANKERLRLRERTRREKSRHEEAERHKHSSSKQRSSSNAEPRRAHHSSHGSSSRSRHRPEVETGGSLKHSSGSRLVRSTRVSEESRQRATSQRSNERSRGNEKHREDLTRSRGHSSRSRHSEGKTSSSTTTKHRDSHSSATAAARSHESTAISAHKKSATTKSTSNTKATHKDSKVSTSTAIQTQQQQPQQQPQQQSQQPHSNELTNSKNAHQQLNGHHHHHQHSHHHQSNGNGSSKHHGHGQQPQHHVHSLTTTTIAATKQQRERHGKDRK